MSSLGLSPQSSDDSLLSALFIAAMIHALLILGIRFVPPEVPKVNKAIEITLSTTPVKKAPKQAQFLAAENQIGAGSEAQKPEPPQFTPPSQGSGGEKPMSAKSASAKLNNAPKVLRQNKSPQKMATSEQPPEETVITEPNPTAERPRLTAEALQNQIAQLGEKIRDSQLGEQNSRIKSANSVSTHKYVAAQYIKDWENKVERTGNLNYPDAANQKGYAKTLTLDVGINTDGSIYSMRINKSSGDKALDEAAKRIVRMSAPFAPLPEALRHEVDVLVITRVWKFSNESGMTTR